MNTERIESAIFQAMDEVNSELPDGMKMERDREAVIFGRGGRLDSLGLVNFVLAVEEKLSGIGLEVSLTDERAMSQSRSPFRSVAALAMFVEQASQRGL